MRLKTPAEITIIQEGATILSRLHGELSKHIQSGITTAFLDQLAETYIKDHQATASFKDFKGYPATLCTSVNDKIIHGIPSKYQLQDGDIISIDCGIYYKGYHSDAAYTHPVGNVHKELLHLLAETKNALYKGIENATAGKRIGDISYAIQHHAESHNYSIIREYGGHGVSKNLHEEPFIPNFGKQGEGVKLQNGMVLAIEPMVALGRRQITIASDNWTVQTQDHQPAAHFEHTVAILEGRPNILTTYEHIQQHNPHG